MRRIVIIAAVLAFCTVLAGTATSSDAAPEAPAVEEQAALDHTHQHTDCLLWAQLFINQVNPGGQVNEWPWFLTGARNQFLFAGDYHTTCELTNTYYGYPARWCVLLNIDHTPVDAGTHDSAFYECGAF